RTTRSVRPPLTGRQEAPPSSVRQTPWPAVPAQSAPAAPAEAMLVTAEAVIPWRRTVQVAPPSLLLKTPGPDRTPAISPLPAERTSGAEGETAGPRPGSGSPATGCQLCPPSPLSKSPCRVLAQRVEGFAGSRARSSTRRSVRPVLAGSQLAPPSVLAKTPTSV